MVRKKSLTIFLLLFLLLGLTGFSFSMTLIPATVAFEKMYEFEFHHDETTPNVKVLVKDISVSNDALIQITCFLFANSTNNITLLVEPEDEWNVSHIKVNRGQTINVTVTNGVVIPPPSDYAASFVLYIQRESVTDVVAGTIVIVVLAYGWTAPWPVIPGMLALLLLYRARWKNNT